MMFCIFMALLLLGAVCLVAEMFTMGFGMFGIGGIIALVISAVIAVLYIPYGWVIVAAEAAALAGLLYFLFKYMQRKKLRGGLIMSESLKEDTPELQSLDGFVGKSGTAVTALRPAGEINVEGVRLEAASDGEFVDEGVRVKVTGVLNNRLVVKGDASRRDALIAPRAAAGGYHDNSN